MLGPFLLGTITEPDVNIYPFGRSTIECWPSLD